MPASDEVIFESWAERSRYDLETAHAMLTSERYLYVLFCCQQAVEKMLKALIASHTHEMPPRIHHLMRLVESAGISLPQPQADFCRELSSYYIQSRYPEEIRSMGREIDKAIAQEIYKKN